MAGPITWRTVMGQSLAEAGRPLEAAQRSISGALTGLGSLVSEQQQLNQNAVDAGREANVQAFMERLQGAQSVDDVAALKSSGELDTLRSALTPKDLVRVRGAEDARATALMQQAVAQRTFASQEAAAKYAPIKDQILASYLSGDPAQQAKAKQMLESNPGIPGMADLVKTMADFDAQKQQRDFAAKLNPLKLQEAQLSLQNGQIQQQVGTEQRALLKLQQAAAQEQALIERDTKTLRDAGNPYANGALTEADSTVIADALAKSGVKDAGTRSAILEGVFANRIQKLEYLDDKGKKQSVEVPIPKDLALQAALSASGGTLFNTDRGPFSYKSSVSDIIKDAMRKVRTEQTADGKEVTVPGMAVDHRRFEEILRRRSQSVPISAGKK